MTRALHCLLPLALLGLACAIEVDGPVGKRCITSRDCPRELVCVAARPGQGRTCEVLALPGQAEVAQPDAGVVFYCDGAENVLFDYCVTCHGVPPAGNAPPTLRLDVYETPDGGPPAVREMAPRIHVRTVVTRDMPPIGNPMPSEEERALIDAWYRSGARECGPDAGLAADAGTGTDAGM